MVYVLCICACAGSDTGLIILNTMFFRLRHIDRATSGRITRPQACATVLMDSVP